MGKRSKWQDLSILTPKEWMKRQSFKRKSNDAKASICKSKVNPKIWISPMFTAESSKFVESQEIGILDLKGSSSSETERVEQNIYRIERDEGKGKRSKWQDLSILTPKEWVKRQSFKRKSNDAKASICESKVKPEKWISPMFTAENSKFVESQEIGILDLKGPSSSETVREEHNIYRNKRDEVNTKSIHTSQDDPKRMELINLSISQDRPRMMIEALKLFEERFLQQLDNKNTIRAYSAAEKYVKEKGMRVRSEKPFGHIPGIKIGDEFLCRAELVITGLHRQYISGIDYESREGNNFATSVVNSCRFENQNHIETEDVLIYSGQGGSSRSAGTTFDQKLEKGNRALVNSMNKKYPIRVIHKIKSTFLPKNSGMSTKTNFVYIYDGLYIVEKFWEERGQNGKLVFKFELHRMDHQPRSTIQAMNCVSRPSNASNKWRTSRVSKEVCVLADISNGKENRQIRAMNGIDCSKPLPFNYTSQVVYPNWFQPIESIGCNCINGCSNNKKCVCVLKNGGEIPFKKMGMVVGARPLVHECGPFCKCPPTCMNRVSQHGPQHQFEIFKTKSSRWGLRSRNYITSGNFVCEYIGEWLDDKEAEQIIGEDKYLFVKSDDLLEEDGEEFEGNLDSKSMNAIDAATYGNIGRYINHSDFPNLCAQKVLYDHVDKRMPHIMFFASKDIPPLRELTYDFNKIGCILDGNGNINTEDCPRGSRHCIL